jgi:hypothetical protein
MTETAKGIIGIAALLLPLLVATYFRGLAITAFRNARDFAPPDTSGAIIGFAAQVPGGRAGVLLGTSLARRRHASDGAWACRRVPSLSAAVLAMHGSCTAELRAGQAARLDLDRSALPQPPPVHEPPPCRRKF